MKKIIKIMLLQVLILFFVINPVKAEEVPCKISLSSNKTSLQPGDEVIVNLSVSNTTISKGIQYISAILDYQADVFDIVYDESDLAEEKLAQFQEGEEEGNVAMIYVGENDTSATGNKWNVVLLYDEDTKTNGILAYSEEAQTQSQTIAKIKFKVKSDAPKTDSKITLEEITVFTEDDADEGTKTEDTSISFSINGKEPVVVEKPENVSKQNVNKQNENKHTTGNNQAISQKETPYTGIEDYIPAIAVIIIISIISYFNYKRLKDIK